jgi:hypothetical protein
MGTPREVVLLNVPPLAKAKGEPFARFNDTSVIKLSTESESLWKARVRNMAREAMAESIVWNMPPAKN